MKYLTLKYITAFAGVFCFQLAGAQPVPKVPASITNTSKESIFSFTPPALCKKPPKEPPKRLLNKRYMVGGYENGFVPDWYRVDLNGDGICDWLRGGIEQSRYDQEAPTAEGSIFLGTPKGWRYWKPTNVKFLPGQFFNPLAAVVYMGNDPRAMVVDYGTLNASDLYVDASAFTVIQWSERYGALRSVDATTTKQVLAFLKRELCVKKTNYSVSEGVTDRITMKGPGTLCGE